MSGKVNGNFPSRVVHPLRLTHLRLSLCPSRLKLSAIVVTYTWTRYACFEDEKEKGTNSLEKPVTSRWWNRLEGKGHRSLVSGNRYVFPCRFRISGPWHGKRHTYKRTLTVCISGVRRPRFRQKCGDKIYLLIAQTAFKLIFLKCQADVCQRIYLFYFDLIKPTV